jgi:acetylglutamate synthase
MIFLYCGRNLCHQGYDEEVMTLFMMRKYVKEKQCLKDIQFEHISDFIISKKEEMMI